MRSVSITRGAGDRKSTIEAQQLPRDRLDLSVYLPFGSEDGPYDVVVESEARSGPVLKTTGEAHIKDGDTVLRIGLDTDGLAPGIYRLHVQRRGSSVRQTQQVVLE